MSFLGGISLGGYFGQNAQAQQLGMQGQANNNTLQGQEIDQNKLMLKQAQNDALVQQSLADSFNRPDAQGASALESGATGTPSQGSSATGTPSQSSMPSSVRNLLGTPGWDTMAQTDRAKLAETALGKDPSFMALPDSQKVQELNSIVKGQVKLSPPDPANSPMGKYASSDQQMTSQIQQNMSLADKYRQASADVVRMGGSPAMQARYQQQVATAMAQSKALQDQQSAQRKEQAAQLGGVAQAYLQVPSPENRQAFASMIGVDPNSPDQKLTQAAQTLVTKSMSVKENEDLQEKLRKDKADEEARAQDHKDSEAVRLATLQNTARHQNVMEEQGAQRLKNEDTRAANVKDPNSMEGLAHENSVLTLEQRQLAPIDKAQTHLANIVALAKSGNPASTAQIQAELTALTPGVRSTNKLYANNAGFGDLYDRFTNSINRVISGKYSATDLGMIENLAKQLDSTVFSPARTHIEQRFGGILKEHGYNASDAGNTDEYANNPAPATKGTPIPTGWKVTEH